jgi:hypothetical protein
MAASGATADLYVRLPKPGLGDGIFNAPSFSNAGAISASVRIPMF